MYQDFTQMTQKTFQDAAKECEKGAQSAQKLMSGIMSLKMKAWGELCSRPNPYAEVTDMPSLVQAQLNWLAGTGDIVVKHATSVIDLIKDTAGKEGSPSKAKEKSTKA